MFISERIRAFSVVFLAVLGTAPLSYATNIGCAIGRNHVLTSYDVTSSGEQLEVSFGSSWTQAELVHSNASEGWALLRLEVPAPEVAPICYQLGGVSSPYVFAHDSGRTVSGYMRKSEGEWTFPETMAALPAGTPIFMSNGSFLVGMVIKDGRILLVSTISLNFSHYVDAGGGDSSDADTTLNGRRGNSRNARCVVRQARARGTAGSSASVRSGSRLSDQSIPPATRKAYDLVKDKLVVIQSDRGSGSGFIIEEKGKNYLITNEHVVHGCERFVAKKFTGEVLKIPFETPEPPKTKSGKPPKNWSAPPPRFAVARGRDLVRFEIPKTDSIPVAASDPSIESTVHVFGNSDGGGVCTLLSGRVLAVGPDQIEVNAHFVSGNSGSPIVNDQGEVLGVATMVTWYEGRPQRLEGTRFGEKRWFGYRLANVEWEPMTWADYSARSMVVRDFATFLKILETFRMPDEEHVRDITLGYTEADGRQFAKTKKFHQLLLRVAKYHKELLESINKQLAASRSREKRQNSESRWYYPSRESSYEIAQREKAELAERRAKSISGQKWKAYANARKAVFTESRAYMSNKNWGCQRLQEEVSELLERLDFILKKSNLNL